MKSSSTLLNSRDEVKPLKKWFGTLVVLGVTAALLLAINEYIVAAAIRVWSVSPTYSHCFFILPISLYLIYLKRADLASIVPEPNPLLAIFAIPFALLQVVGNALSIHEFQQFGLIGILIAACLACIGWRGFRILAFPLFYLFFLVPTGEYLVAPMQAFTTAFISVGLKAIGILHYTEGTLIFLPDGTFRVAEACAGLRFLIATVAVGALFSYFQFRKWYKILVFMLSCIVVPIIANGFRALGIVLLAHFSNNKIAVGADHLIYGWGFSVVILAILMFVGSRFADPEIDAQPAGRPQLAASTNKTLSAAAIILLLASAYPASAAYQGNLIEPLPIKQVVAAMTSDGWIQAADDDGWQPIFSDPDAHLEFSRKTRDQVEARLMLVYYDRKTNGHSVISSVNRIWDEERWHVVTANDVQSKSPAGPIRFKELLLASGPKSRLVWWTYWASGHPTLSAVDIKLTGLRSLLAEPAPTAFVAFSTPVDGDQEIARKRLVEASNSFAALSAAMH